MAKVLGLILVLVLVGGLTAAFSPPFLSPANLDNVARHIGLHGVLALGAGLVIISGGIDLSVGSMVAFSGLLFTLAFQQWGWPGWAAWLLTLGASTLIGCLQGSLVAGARLQPFIVTLCGLLIVRGLARFITEDQSRGLGGGDASLTFLVEGHLLGLSMPLWILGGLAAGLVLLLHTSVLGRHLFALGSNEEAARLAGVPVGRLKVLVYSLSGLLAGFAGVLFLVYTNSVQPANAGLGYELYAIAAAVLGGVSLRGGVGTVAGVLVGTALIRVLVNATNLMRVPTYLDHTVVGLAILLGVLLDEVGRRWRR